MDDTARSLALGSACAAFVLVPTVGPLVTGRGEQTERYDTVVTPPEYAFAIWAPIFAGCAASTVAQVRAGGRTAAVSRRTGWPLAGAYAANALWSLAAQGDRFALTPVILPVAAGFAALAHDRLQSVPPAGRPHRATALSTGLLTGWTVLAGAVNLVAGAQLLGADPRSSATVAAAGGGALAVAAGVAAAVLRSRVGGLPLAAGPVWGLATTALSPSRPRPARLAAALGVVAVAAAAAVRSRARA